MAGTIVANTINTDTGVFTTNNAYLGVAKAWCKFYYNGTTAVIQGTPFNISSITVNSNQDFTANFITNMNDANYSVIGLAGQNSANLNCIVIPQNTAGYTPTTSSFRFQNVYQNSSFAGSPNYIQVVVFGN